MEYMPVVIDAKYLSDYKMKIIFDNGEEKITDFVGWLDVGTWVAKEPRNIIGELIRKLL